MQIQQQRQSKKTISGETNSSDTNSDVTNPELDEATADVLESIDDVLDAQVDLDLLADIDDLLEVDAEKFVSEYIQMGGE